MLETILPHLTAPVIAAGSLALTAAAVWPFITRRNLKDANGNPLPPGPFFRLASLGQYNELIFDKWAKKYGPLTSAWFGDQLFVIISDARVAQNILVDNGAIFSSRKDYFVKNQLILHDRALTANPYDARWRNHRKMAIKYLSEKAVATYADAIQGEVVTLLRSLYEESDNWSKPISPALPAVRYTLNNMLGVSFAMRTDSIHDPLLENIQKLVMEFDDITGPSSNVIDFIKPLQYLPSTMKNRALTLNKELNKQYGGMIAEMQGRLDRGEPVEDCLMKELLETGKEQGFDSEDILMLAVAFAFGGVHSIAGILQWFLAFMATYPEVANRAQAEMDRVVGRDRLPTNEDEPNLPYTRAIIKEVARIHSPFWVPTPHYSTADYTYNGMFIPKGTVVILNVWTIHHNEERYPDAFTFNPDRFLGDELSSAASAKQADAMKRDHWAFGGGRRICPGFNIAEREIWLAISGLLWAYTFHKVPEFPISMEEYEGSSGRTPLPFKMKLMPRHERAREIIEGGAEKI